jgi:PAS domain-containing protein
LKIAIEQAITAQISGFGAAVSQFNCDDTCNAPPDGPGTKSGETLPIDVRFLRVFFPPTEFNSQDQDAVDKAYQAAKKHHTKYSFFGDMTPLSDDNTGPIEFLIPRGKNRVFAIKFDLKSYEERRTLWLSLAAVCGAITSILAILIVTGYGLKLREQERAFAVVDTVMSDVPAPYARLDEDAKFLRVNDSFAKLVGYDSAAEANIELPKYKYEDFLVGDESKEEFHKIKQERREGKPYRSYTIQFWTGRTPGKPPIKWLKVHAGDVPTPHSGRNKPGQSFGILLPTSAPGAVLVMAPPVNPELGGGTKPTDQLKTG